MASACSGIHFAIAQQVTQIHPVHKFHHDEDSVPPASPKS